jgi:ribulose-5-phosphate 4-epimerase/fuculose-1-phosphate aldolase
VICAAHTHSIYGRTFSTLGIPLPITSQDGCAFYKVCDTHIPVQQFSSTDSFCDLKDLALLNHFEGIVLEASEGAHIAQAIGDKKAVILQNHGLMTAAGSVEACVFWYISLERLCYTQLLAMAAAGPNGVQIKEVGEAEAKESVPPESLPT